LYVGKTTDLVQRVWQHKAGLVPGFTKKYSVHKLVYYEIHDSEENALLREKRIKRWRRAWKIQMIEESNPEWEDLYDSVTP
jgi:putative endonuclease